MGFNRDFRVMHVGPYGDLPGGVAQVINEFLKWDLHETNVTASRSTLGKGDRLWPLRWLSSFGRVVLFSRFKRRAVVVVHLSQGGSFFREGSLLVLAHALGLSTVAFQHGSSFVEFATKRPSLVGFVIGRSDLAVSLTSATTNAITSLCSTRVLQTVNSVSVPTTVVPKRNIVTFAGEVGTRKGADVLISAWALVSQETKRSWQLHIAGPISDLEVTSVLNADSSLLYRGTLTNAEVKELLEETSIAVLPSRGEAMPIFLLEAMARSAVPVATPVGQIPELLGEDAGILVPVDAAVELAKTLESLMHDPKLVWDIGHKARARIQTRHDSQAHAIILRSVWRALVAK